MKLHFIFLLLIFSTQVQSQIWFQDQDSWVYRTADGLSGYAGYDEISVEGDTVLEGKNCKKLLYRSRGYSYRQRDTLESTSTQFAYEEANKVYFFIFGQFQLRYDFTLGIGDTLQLISQNPNYDENKLVLDSLSTSFINTV